MSEPLRCLPQNAVVVGYDFSTGGVKALAFDMQGKTLATIRAATDLWMEYRPIENSAVQEGLQGSPLYTPTGGCELNLMQLEGQAYAATRGIAAALNRLGRL